MPDNPNTTQQLYPDTVPSYRDSGNGCIYVRTANGWEKVKNMYKKTPNGWESVSSLYSRTSSAWQAKQGNF